MKDAGIVWFQGLGFRPAVLTPPHRADQVDPARIVPASDADVAYLGKFDPFGHLPAAGYAWGTVLWSAQDGQGKSQQLLTETPETPPYHGHYVSTPPQPEPWFPCCVIREPDTPLPPVAPVPIPATAGLLIAAVAVFAIIRRRK